MNRRGWKIILLLVILWHSHKAIQPSIERVFLYPYHYGNIVHEEAKKYLVDEDLIHGIILAESKYKSESKSHVGALGLMQLMPETAKWISEQLEEPFDEHQLYNPAINIHYGAWYIAHLLDAYDGNVVLALAAYNAGKGQVDSWMEEKHWNKSFQEIEAIPFPETKEYVRKVIYNMKKYEALYERK